MDFFLEGLRRLVLLVVVASLLESLGTCSLSSRLISALSSRESPPWITNSSPGSSSSSASTQTHVLINFFLIYSFLELISNRRHSSHNKLVIMLTTNAINRHLN